MFPHRTTPPLERRRTWRTSLRAASVAIGVTVLAAICVQALHVVLAAEASRDAISARESAARAQVFVDVKRLAGCLADVNELWPADPEHTASMETWLCEAEDLAQGLAAHRAELERLRERALPYDERAARRDRARDPRAAYLAQLRDRRVEIAAAARAGEEGDGLGGRHALEIALAHLDEEIERCGAEIAERATFEFSDAEEGWQHDLLRDLVAGLESLADPQAGMIADVRCRLEQARSLRQRTLDEPRALWERAIASIRDRRECPQYGGLAIAPQIGLVPIGRDPASGLWEFGHVPSGGIPASNAKGKLEITEEAGLVLVLIPGGSFMMGAQSADPSLPGYDPGARPEEGPVHTVRLDAFFLAKEVMTRAQWRRIAGGSRAEVQEIATGAAGSRSGRDPMAQVSFDECREMLRRLALVIPTEAQWEHAMRAGGELSELSSASDFGLLDADFSGQAEAHGEWCRDEFGDYSIPVCPGDGERLVHGSGLRSVRGSPDGIAESNLRPPVRDDTAEHTWRTASAPMPRSASSARVTGRAPTAPGNRGSRLWIRPARMLDG